MDSPNEPAYCDSSEEEDTLLSHHQQHNQQQQRRDEEDAYSQSSSSTFQSDSTYASEQRRPFFHGATSNYTRSRRELNKLLKSKNDLALIEEELEQEKSKGRYLLFTCLVMCVVCGFLFADRWPEDWRGALIEVLEKGRPETSKTSASSTMEDDKVKDKKKDPLKEFYKGEDDDDHYSKYGTSAIEQYEAMQKKKSKIHHKPKEDVQDDDDKSHPVTEKEKLIKENEKQHIDNLAKYLKWNLPFKKDRDVPLFWNIPLTGAMFVDEILGRCYKLVQAADDASILTGHEKDGILHVITVEPNSKKYVNVNMGSISGIKHAKDLHLASSGTVEVIRTPYYIYEADFLFEKTPNYGKCFTMMREPVERSIDVFYKLQESSTNVVFQNMTINEYVRSSYCEDNWMVRVLSNEMEGELKKEHLDLAKHILGRKFIIGITEDFEESVRRFAKYFHWDDEVSNDDLLKCQNEELEVSRNVKEGGIYPISKRTATVKHGDEVYKMLETKNSMDIQLYNYAKSLYKTQSIYSHLL